jgi:hypothetical protein
VANTGPVYFFNKENALRIVKSQKIYFTLLNQIVRIMAVRWRESKYTVTQYSESFQVQLAVVRSVSDPHSLYADPDPGF